MTIEFHKADAIVRNFKSEALEWRHLSEKLWLIRDLLAAKQMHGPAETCGEAAGILQSLSMDLIGAKPGTIHAAFEGMRKRKFDARRKSQ